MEYSVRRLVPRFYVLDVDERLGPSHFDVRFSSRRGISTDGRADECGLMRAAECARRFRKLNATSIKCCALEHRNLSRCDARGGLEACRLRDVTKLEAFAVAGSAKRRVFDALLQRHTANRWRLREGVIYLVMNRRQASLTIASLSPYQA